MNTKNCSHDQKLIGTKIIGYLRHEASNDMRDGAIGWAESRAAMDSLFARKIRRSVPSGEEGNVAVYNYMHVASNRVRYEILYAIEPDGSVVYKKRMRVRVVQGHSDKSKNRNKGGAGHWDFRTQYNVDPKKYSVACHATSFANVSSIRQ